MRVVSFERYHLREESEVWRMVSPCRCQILRSAIRRSGYTSHRLALNPGQTGRLPAPDGAAMSLLVERSFKTAGDVVAGAVARRRHRLGRGQAPAPGTANEEEVAVELQRKGPELTGKPLSEARVHGLIGKALPFDEDGAFTYGSEIRNPDIGPFCARANIDQLGASTRGEALPSRLHINGVNRFIAVLHS